MKKGWSCLPKSTTSKEDTAAVMDASTAPTALKTILNYLDLIFEFGIFMSMRYFKYNKHKDKKTTRYKQTMEDRPGFARHQLMSQNRNGSINGKIHSSKIAVQAPFRISDEKWITGKHKGKKINESATDYIEWMIENTPMPNPHRLTLERELKNRK